MPCKCSSYQRNYTPRMSPTLNGSSEIQCFECSDAIEIRNGILLDFYTGLPHVFTLRGSKSHYHAETTGWDMPLESSPEVRVPANTQHWAYLTVLLVSRNSSRMAELPLKAVGLVPSL